MIGRRGDNRCEKMRRFWIRNSEMTSLASTVARSSAARGCADAEQRETKRMQRTKAEIECKKKKKEKKNTREPVGKMLQRWCNISMNALDETLRVHVLKSSTHTSGLSIWKQASGREGGAGGCVAGEEGLMREPSLRDACKSSRGTWKDWVAQKRKGEERVSSGSICHNYVVVRGKSGKGLINLI